MEIKKRDAQQEMGRRKGKDLALKGHLLYTQHYAGLFAGANSTNLQSTPEAGSLWS